MANPDEIVNGNYKFHSHDHQLHLVLTPTQHEHEEENEEEEYNNGDDDDGGGFKPIFSKKQEKSSAYYLSCGECKYFLHWVCFHLPPDLPSHPLHQQQNHNLTLRTSPKLDYTLCSFHTNGLFYECTNCYFKADIKCASLPNTIKHGAHPHHLLNLLNKDATSNQNYWERLCGACGRGTYGDACYKCDICEIILHSSCALLPPVVSDSEWDKHPLPLMFDASVDHPSGFYCDVCEGRGGDESEEVDVALPRLRLLHASPMQFDYARGVSQRQVRAALRRRFRALPPCHVSSSDDKAEMRRLPPKKGLRGPRISVHCT